MKATLATRYPGPAPLVTLLEAYFDESGSHDGSPILCVAGYLFEKDRCQQLDLEWKAVLDRFSLPYFHMVDCAHGNDPFDKLSMSERIECEKEMIALIRKYALFGFAMAVVEKEYDEVFPPHSPRPYKSAYTYCCWTALAVIHEWIVRNLFSGKIAYFFEAGHKHAPEANAIMNVIFNHPGMRDEYRYSAHAFVPKETVRPVQTADILAWQHATDVKKIQGGDKKKRRKDFEALIDDQPIMLRYVHREHLETMRKQTDAALRGHPLISGRFGQWSFVSTT
jgi:hypothetical protein